MGWNHEEMDKEFDWPGGNYTYKATQKRYSNISFLAYLIMIRCCQTQLDSLIVDP